MVWVAEIATRGRGRATGPYPEGTSVLRPNRSGRMFNLRPTDEQLGELHALARERHLPTSTTARSELLERLDQERRAG